MRDRPNILLVLCDDLNCMVNGFGGSLHAPTPNIDRLREKGTSFMNAQNNSPVCVPSRDSLFSGIYPHRSGSLSIWDHWANTVPPITTRSDNPFRGVPLLKDAVRLPEHLKHNGYRVYGVGKLLHHGITKKEMWSEYGEGPNYGPFVYDSQTEEVIGHPRNAHLFKTKAAEDYTRRYSGIDRCWLMDDRMRFPFEFDCGPMDEYYAPCEGVKVFYDPQTKKPFHYVSDDDRDPLPDEAFTDWAIDKLQQQRDEPFFLGVGYMKPHTPMIVPREYFQRFPLDEIELPPILEGDTDDCARAAVEHNPYGFAQYKIATENDNGMLKKFVQAYLASVAFVDHQFGRLLDALEASPYADNTVILFTSDNGYHLGEKEYLFKDSFWEESDRIPLIISHPGITGGDACTQPVSLIDLYPTLVDLCSLPADPNRDVHGHPLDGHSLRPLMEKPDGEWGGPSVALTSAKGRTGIHHSVRSERYRYTLCSNGEEELYDHANDPFEWHNVAGRDEYEDIRKHHRRALLDLVHG